MTREIKVLALQSPQIVIGALAPVFEQQTGYRIRQVLGSSAMPAHITSDMLASFDAAFVVPAVLDKLEAEGRIAGGTRRPFVRVPIGVAVRAGMPKPDIHSIDALKGTLLKARSVAYLAAGTSGPYLDRLFRRLGIAAAVAAKAKRPETDTVGELVAQGVAEIGVTAMATLMASPGVEVVGPLPEAIQSYVVFECAIGPSTSVMEIAAAFVDYLTSPAAFETIRSKGMEPGVLADVGNPTVRRQDPRGG